MITWPLVALAILSIVGGFMGIEQRYGSQLSIRAFESGVFAQFHDAPLAAGLGLLAVLVGFAAAWAIYFKAAKDPLPEKLGVLSRAMQNRFYFDELYEATFIRLHDLLAAIAGWIDRWLIAGLAVRGTHGTTELVGRALRLLQTGNLQTYAFLFAMGAALVLYLVFHDLKP